METAVVHVQAFDEGIRHFACVNVEPFDLIQLELATQHLSVGEHAPGLQPLFLVVRGGAIRQELNDA